MTRNLRVVSLAAAISTVSAVVLLAPPPASAQDQRSVLRDACRGDYQKLCASVSPGGGRILKCLESNADQLTPACKAALAARAGK
ncbi:hypothetical protein A33M_2144 [Rhodovulum sp. PH10]|uniref:cysteine rich repeat-containing protein n=1 Tax=Rhodovulum sp. PH10 TaxID=1187851 RepID=UPI00027C21CA|nr:cysteine rich repeat-containing protein [Rhodovulum sp. PH10]EJW12381.1 hypothetical protein A33M_2144 [Rhodovulum sp. PH10]